MWSRPHWGEAGFSLLEVMIALAVLAIAVVAVLKSQSAAFTALDEARHRTVAVWLAQAKMAELESRGIGEGTTKGDFGDEAPGFRWEIRVSTPLVVTYVRKGVVRVVWHEGAVERYVQLEGFF